MGVDPPGAECYGTGQDSLAAPAVVADGYGASVALRLRPEQIQKMNKAPEQSNPQRGGASDYLYDTVADDLARAINEGIYPPGERLPSLRAVRERYGVSLATAVQALQRLEARGLVVARPRSGYFVRAWRAEPVPAPGPTATASGAVPVSVARLAMDLVERAADRPRVNLGAAIPSREFLPLKPLAQASSHVSGDGALAAEYAPLHGDPALRESIAQRLQAAGAPAGPDAIIVTNGCMEALTLALEALTRAGDAVAIESPTYFGVLQVIEGLGLNAVEVPTDPQCGMNLDALEARLAGGGIAAVISIPTFHNPLGFCMSEAAKRRLVSLTAAAGVPLIEDDIYGELTFSQPRPRPAAAFDTTGNVVLCSSFSKTLAPGYRVGWVVPGRQHEAIAYRKFIANVATASLPQRVLAEFLGRGRSERLLRRAGETYARRVAAMRALVARHFPPGTTVTDPAGGYVVWVALPAGTDSLALYRRALEQDIVISPGPLFTPSESYRNCLRLNCAVVTGEAAERAVATLGALAGELAPKGG